VFPSCRAVASTAAKQQAQDELQDSQAQARKLQSKLEAAQEAAQQAKQQVWQLEQSNTQLAQQAAKQAAESDFLEAELAGLRESEVRLREQVAVQQEQVGSLGPCQLYTSDRLSLGGSAFRTLGLHTVAQQAPLVGLRRQ
jgi:septal ring factor EnvC (AmiA/AmiB activator)